MRWFLANTFVRTFRKWGFCGNLRFWITRIGYKILWTNGPRNGEWDFVLQYLSPLEKWYKNYLRVLDVGCSESLLIYEFARRGYITYGLDQRKYQEKLPKYINFLKWDIRQELPLGLIGGRFFDFIVSISTIEHIGMGGYGDKKSESGDRKAMENIYKLLVTHGFFIITVPLYYWTSGSGRGYTYESFKELIKDLFDIYEITQRKGQICATLVKKF